MIPDRRQALKMLGGLALGLAGGALAQQESALKGLQAQGVGVKVVLQDDLSPLKRRYGIPPEAQSCHTMRVAGYTVEEHVPLTTLRKLLRERPRIDRIALPGMPSDTPEMPGDPDVRRGSASVRVPGGRGWLERLSAPLIEQLPHGLDL